ncbi:PREDICTED: 5-hydroxytryptamine receptor 4-like [Poecilia mexicana]|uniref:5-hydroxytryptamine receptor 4 n=1 Tax=Poecilia mexicana TaxID=48701 RepID=A0A3B3YXJ9_9TELE|nr:PREDICTED: 5-hydroxytryptamine receptor 4-like [Poecilia formosa]XP_014850709.1 PREDICTED: 5-hydroxytryptamine receptor 4-like [Poecilia mexicana]XP_014850711.1 PREDICTED: 5-hydroxytryptamine receptor 4-like [Poecilia mexicana]XP_014850712.1 PREDICTED: 5-hydroxytryptamine receptor 4-like [Poecilia mexicana]XP_014850713.1 PREDICTED: 5-hydroxytryptamine receptor 4-like [Poecilia mexicana]XP_014850714.1 PREDICTED: 5-hydroxytryptamine receptor 4-like [Poecilia mexicana]XP_014850715.1 PREDICTED
MATASPQHFLDNVINNGQQQQEQQEFLSSWETVFLTVFLSVIIILTVFGNLLVMVALCKDRHLRRKKTSFFIVSLAFADLLVALFVMPLAAIELTTGQWHFGEIFCLVRTSLDVLLTTASILHLCCIALDRYYAICCQPLVYRSKMTPVRVAFMLIGCWVIPTFISFLPIMQKWNTIGIEDIIEEKQSLSGGSNTSCVFLVNQPYALICSAVAFYIPLALMVLAYHRIYVTAMVHVRQIETLQRAGSVPITCSDHVLTIRSSTSSDPLDHYRLRTATVSLPSEQAQGRHRRIRIETRAAKTLAIIMGCFSLCWAPFFITNVVDPFINYSVPWQMWTAWLWLGYINSGLNPFLYAYLNQAFRRAFLAILCCGDERYTQQGICSTGFSRPSVPSANGTSMALRLSFLPNRSYSDNGQTILANEQESQDSLGPL